MSGCRKAKLPRCLPGLRCAERAVPAGLCPSCTKCTSALLYTALGRQAYQESLHSCICSVLLDLMAVPHFSVSCRSVRVLTVFLYWQYWCECSECLCCWTNEDHFPLIFYSGLRGRLLSLNKTSKLKSLTTKLKTQSKRFSSAQELEQSVAFISGKGREVLNLWLRRSGVGGQDRS